MTNLAFSDFATAAQENWRCRCPDADAAVLREGLILVICMRIKDAARIENVGCGSVKSRHLPQQQRACLTSSRSISSEEVREVIMPHAACVTPPLPSADDDSDHDHSEDDDHNDYYAGGKAR